MARPKEFDQQEVIAKAMDLFQRQGYDATSVRDLLEHTGLSSSSLYASFGGKEQLFLRALRAHAAQERHQLEATLTAPGGIRNNIRAVFNTLIDLLMEPSNNSSLTLRAAVEQAAGMPPVFALLSEYIQELTDMFAKLLQEAESNGQIQLRFPATDTAHFLLFSAYNLGVVARVGRSRDQLERYTNIALAVLGSASPQVSS